jgi:hypothetical protein
VRGDAVGPAEQRLGVGPEPGDNVVAGERFERRARAALPVTLRRELQRPHAQLAGLVEPCHPCPSARRQERMTCASSLARFDTMPKSHDRASSCATS